MFFFCFDDNYLSPLPEWQAIEFELATLEVFGPEAVVDIFPVDDDYVVSVDVSDISGDDLAFEYGE